MPFFEVVSSGSHFDLKVSFAGAIAVCAACMVIADECGNDAFDGGAEAHILLEGFGLGVENGLVLLLSVRTNKDLSAGIGFGRFAFWLGCGSGWRSLCTLRCRVVI